MQLFGSGISKLSAKAKIHLSVKFVPRENNPLYSSSKTKPSIFSGGYNPRVLFQRSTTTFSPSKKILDLPLVTLLLIATHVNLGR